MTVKFGKCCAPYLERAAFVAPAVRRGPLVHCLGECFLTFETHLKSEGLGQGKVVSKLVRKCSVILEDVIISASLERALHSPSVPGAGKR